METLWKDIRFGLRMLAQKPAFTAVAVLTLALGIGANTAIFTLFDSLLLESMPVHDPGRLVLFSSELSEGTYTGDAPTGPWPWFSFEFYEFLSKQALPFESVCAFRMGESAVSVHFAAERSDEQTRRAVMHLVSGNYFTVMGVDAAMGRMLAPADDRPNSPPVAVVSYGYWKQRLRADPAAIGKVAILNGTAFTIVGVAPPEFFGERVRRPPDYWLPLAFQPRMEPYKYLDDTNAYGLNMMGRLRPGATREQAQAAVTVALQQFLRDKAGAHISADRAQNIAKSYIQLSDGGRGLSQLRFQYSQPLHILLVVVGMVLLIASANVGSLLLARAVSRRAEISLRLALGASRGRLIRQLLTESILLAAIGAGCGFLLAHWGVKVLAAYMAEGSPQQPHLNLQVLLFTLGITLLAGILFGLAPALQSVRTDLISVLKAGSIGAGSGRRSRSTQGLVIVQIAVSLVLLVGAGLFARSLLNLERLPLGFDSRNVLLARIDPRFAGYKPENVGALYRQLLDRLNELPGVRAATIAYYSPLSGSKSTTGIEVEGYALQSGEHPKAETIEVCANYPKVLGIPLLLGRAIGFEDTAASPKVAMVNETFVRHFFPNQDPIGHRFSFGSRRSYEIVGVLGDAHFQDARERQADVVFLSLMQDQTPDALRAEIEVRTDGNLRDMSAAIRKLVAQVDPTLPITGVQSLRAQIDANYDRERLAARFVSFFSGLALLLACVGLYGVVAQDVARRRTEIGVRMALGAQRTGILRMVLRDTAVLLLGGLALGIPAAFAAAEMISSQLFGLRTGDLVSFMGAIAILAVVMAFAGFLPAHRASRVDPMVALRYE